MSVLRRVGRERSTLVVAVAVVADVVVTIFRFVAAAVTGSSALLAQAFQSTAESVNQALLFRGQAGARRDETPQHPFGYARERYFWAFVVSFLIFGVGATAAFVEAYAKLRNPEPVTHPPWAFAALGLALVLDGTSFLVARRQARRERAGPMLEYVRESKSPEISVVMLQDSAAVVGLAIAGAAVTSSLVTDTPAFDAAGSAAIGCLLTVVAFALARRMKSLLIGEAAPDEEVDEIRRIILGHDDVRALISLRTLYHGPDELVVEAQVAFDDDLRFRAVARAVDDIEAGIRRRIDSARLVAIEPAVPATRDPGVPRWQAPDGGTAGAAAGRLDRRP
jgi:cation diffusion facilitator family transporter